MKIASVNKSKLIK